MCEEPPASPLEPSRARGRARALLVLLALGVGVRLGFLLLVGELDYHADEVGYLDLAIAWNRFGSFGDNGRFAWPPAYPWLLARGLAAFGASGVVALKLGQVLASAIVGLATILFARRLFDERAARLAGALWAGYLPLVAFTHLLWPETFFLALFGPALLLLLAAVDAPVGSGRGTGALVAAGLLLGLAALFKELVVGLVPLLALVLATAGRPGALEGLRRATLLLLAFGAVVAPWIARNHEVYGRLTSTGITLGENAYRGLNARYVSLDANPLARDREHHGAPEAARPWFVDPGAIEPWPRASSPQNLADLSRDYVREGLAFAREHPGYVARTRLKKLADLATPLSFYVRHHALGLYGGPTSLPGVRHGLILLALLAPVAVLVLALPGLARLRRGDPARLLLLVVALYVLATGLLMSSSRFRAPLLPILIALAGGGLSATLARRPPTGAGQAVVATGLSALVFLWWVGLPETLAIWRLAL